MLVWLCLISNIWNGPARQAQGWFTVRFQPSRYSAFYLYSQILSHGVIIGLDYRFGCCFLRQKDPYALIIFGKLGGRT